MNRFDEKLNELDRMLAERKYEQAFQLSRKLTRDRPAVARGWLSRSEAARALGQQEEAVRASARAVELDSKSGLALAQYARCLLPGADYRLLGPVLARGLTLRHESTWVTETLAASAVGIDDWPRARSYYEQLVQRHGTRPQYRHMLAVACNVLGDVDTALKQLKRLIRQQPAYGPAYWTLMEIDASRVTPELEKDIVSCSEDTRLEESQKMHFYHVRATLAHRKGNYAEAFQWYSKANSVRRSRLRYSLEDDERLFAAIQSAFGAAADLPAMGSDGPIFVVGLPRSGSTLVEQLLVNSGAVDAPGELRDFEALLSAPQTVLSTLTDEQLADMPNRDFRTIGNEYLDRVAARLGPGRRFVDKNPFNFRLLGMILQALPAARIVHVRKQPLEACLGTFRHLFASVAPWSCTLGEVAGYYRLYTSMMSHWQKQYPDHILTIDYENLIREPKTAAERLYAHCGLAWSDEFLEVKGDNRAIHSASVSQVRQGINSRALGVASHYDEQLKPLKRQLQTWKLI